MPSLNLDINYFENIKVIRLQARLGNGSDVLPIRLWCYAAKHHPETGRLALLNYEIEKICGWWGTKGEMVAAMVETKLIRKVGDFYEINDWFEYEGHLAVFKKRAKKAAQKRWGIKTKSSNASSIAKPMLEQCPNNTMQFNTIHSIKDTTFEPLKNGVQNQPEPSSKPLNLKELTPVQKVVMVWKKTTGFEYEDKGWDKAHFARCSRSAKTLIEFLGGWENACDCIEDVHEKLSKKGLSVTLETVVKHSADWKKDFNEMEAKANGILPVQSTRNR